jgi:hypothetical protein
MISLPALEEPFVRRYPPAEGGPRVAVEGVETEAGYHIILFTTEALNLREANAILWENGFRGVMRLDEVRRLEKIPVLGTGKTDYKVLRELAAAYRQGATAVSTFLSRYIVAQWMSGTRPFCLPGSQELLTPACRWQQHIPSLGNISTRSMRATMRFLEVFHRRY